MATKAIKGVSEDVWNKFKTRAASKGMGMAEYFSRIIEDSEKSDTSKWLKSVLAHAKNNPLRFTAKDMARMNDFRKRFAMRKFK